MPGTQIYLGEWQDALTCHWELEAAAGLFLRDTNTQTLLRESDIRTVETGQIYSLADMGIQMKAWRTASVLGGLTYDGDTSFGNDDYHADLDAENVYHLIISGNSYLDAHNGYYESLCVSTRGEQFVSHICYETIESMIYYELIDKDLYTFIGLALEQEDYVRYQFYQNLLLDEQYHIDLIRESYPDTYNFMCSVRDGLSDLADYREET